jgi:hypothetical protein
MNSIAELVLKLINNPDVVGLLEYGNAQYTDQRVDGDYDLIVVVEERDRDVESLHFHVAGVPVDLNVRSLDDIRDTWCATSRAEQAELLRDIAEAVLEPVGGLWKDDEILTFGDQEKGKELFNKLFFKGR